MRGGCVKVGDLVKLSAAHGPCDRVGLIVELIEKKCWRTEKLGVKVDWKKIDPEPHAVVLISGDKRAIPVTDLELLDER